MPETGRTGSMYRLDVVAAYNREELPLMGRRGSQVTNVEDVMDRPFLWAFMTERDREEILMDLYVARRTKMQ